MYNWKRRFSLPPPPRTLNDLMKCLEKERRVHYLGAWRHPLISSKKSLKPPMMPCFPSRQPAAASLSTNTCSSVLRFLVGEVLWQPQLPESRSGQSAEHPGGDTGKQREAASLPTFIYLHYYHMFYAELWQLLVKDFWKRKIPPSTISNLRQSKKLHKDKNLRNSYPSMVLCQGSFWICLFLPVLVHPLSLSPEEQRTGQAKASPVFW